MRAASQGKRGEPDERTSLLVGRSLYEPVARYGLFVMNTTDAIVKAFEDYQSRKFLD